MRSPLFEEVEIGAILEKVSNPVNVQLDASYRQIGVRSHGKGLFDKEPVTGAALGDKRVFWVEPDCFVVNIVFAWEQAVCRTTKDDIGKIASHRFPMYRPKNGKSDIDFINYLFKTDYGKDLLTLASPGGAGRNKTLGQSEFLKLRVRIPPAAEQRRVAEILLTWDRAIETVEALIANARTQKAALMCVLLTGKTRIPGCSGAWSDIELGEVVTFKNGLNGDKSLYGAGTKFVNVMDVLRSSTLRHVDIVGSMAVTPRQQEDYIVKKGDILFNRTSETDEEIALSTVYVDDEPAVFGGFVIRARPIGKALHPDFSVYAFQSPEMRRSLVRLGQGAIRANIGQADLATVRLRLPPHSEQQQIAALLCAWDRAIEAQELMIASTRAQKAALMQQLLTGKRRVMTTEGAPT